MGSANDEEKLTFEVNLPDIQRLTIQYKSNISGKLEAIKDALDSGLTLCLSNSRDAPIRNLLDDLKNFQQNWPACGRFLTIDGATRTCNLHLMEVREMALQVMLANRVNSRLKMSHLLAPQQLQQPPQQLPQQQPSQVLVNAPKAPPRSPKPAKQAKPIKPPKPPKTPVVVARAAPALRRQSEPASQVSETSPGGAAVDLTKLAPVPAPRRRSASSVPSDSGGSEHSLSDVNGGESPRLDLRKTFYCEDMLVKGVDNVAVAEAASAAATVQNFSYANALEELIATEKKYIRRMALLYDHYLPRLCNDLPHLAEQLTEIFFDFDTFRKLHMELLQDLEEMAQEAGSDMKKFEVGKVMAKYGPHLRLYSVYYTKYKLHLNQINDWMKDEASKAAFLRARGECPDPADRMLDVTSHMLEPVQRPLRYPMLVARYLKEIGQDHQDRQRAQRALEIIENVSNGFNVKMSEVEGVQKLLVILQEVTFPSELHAERDKFICSQYQLSARVLKISSKNQQQIRFLILSSTVLLLCEVNALNWKTVQRAIPVSSDLVLSLDEKLSADYPNCIRLQTQEKTYDFSFATLEEFDDWIAAFKRLNVTFSDTSPMDEKFPWKTFDDESLGKKQPMKLKDHDVSQCQACSVAFTVFNRRHHCRICGGIYCGVCSKYKCRVAWAESQRRVCFFCKERMDKRDGVSGVLDIKHRELIERFQKRQEHSGGALIQGYLNVRVEVLKEKVSKSPGFLQDHWVKMWCTADKEVFSIYKMKKDFQPAYKVVLAMNLKVELTDDFTEIQLRMKDIETCRLRMTEDSSLRSAEREASHLQDWVSILTLGANVLCSV